MRKLVLLSVCGLVLSAVVLAGLYLPHEPTEAFFLLPFPAAFLSFGSALYIVNEKKLGRLQPGRVWAVLCALPLLVRAGLVALFVATTLNYFTTSGFIQTQLGFKRGYAGNCVWLCAVGTALLYGIMLQQQRGLPTVRKPSKVVVGVFVAIGVALGLVGFVRDRDTIFDDEATHQRIAAQFAGAAWTSHLVAASTDHAAFIVYLDTKDPGIQAAACDDLKPVAAQLDRVPDLYHVSGKHSTYVRSC